MLGDIGQMSKYGAFKKTSIPVPFLRGCFCFLFMSHWYGSSGDLLTSGFLEAWISAWQLLESSVQKKTYEKNHSRRSKQSHHWYWIFCGIVHVSRSQSNFWTPINFKFTLLLDIKIGRTTGEKDERRWIVLVKKEEKRKN